MKFLNMPSCTCCRSTTLSVRSSTGEVTLWAAARSLAHDIAAMRPWKWSNRSMAHISPVKPPSLRCTATYLTAVEPNSFLRMSSTWVLRSSEGLKSSWRMHERWLEMKWPRGSPGSFSPMGSYTLVVTTMVGTLPSVLVRALLEISLGTGSRVFHLSDTFFITCCPYCGMTRQSMFPAGLKTTSRGSGKVHWNSTVLLVYWASLNTSSIPLRRSPSPGQ
mmetsp:Transcript_6076/g.13203  ORF Transcript_6076/g.13203 Transcript_6076/m.13203 type:complete len:219 (-) Transcript_6076:472-1128(-)